MLGFSCVQEFICKYYRLLVTMILPYCVKEPRCKGLLISISKITRKPVNNLFIVSFLRIYTHIYLTEEPEIGNRCIEMIGRCTGASLSKLMNTDVKVRYIERHICFCKKFYYGLNIQRIVITHSAKSSFFETIPFRLL